MKKISSVVCLLFLVLPLIISCQSNSSDWMEYRVDNYGNVYSYKKGNIDKNNGNYIVQVFYKTVYSEKGREKYLQERREKKYSTEGYDKLSHTVYSTEVDCKKQEIKLLSVVESYADGEKLFSWSNDKPEWINTIPGSEGETVLKLNCE